MRLGVNHRRGQTSLIMIMIAAVGLIFFAATLNWGKVAQSKTQTTIAANTAAAALASGGASYGEQVLQEQLGGRPKICKSTSIWAAIAAVVLVIIIIVLSVISAGSFAAFMAANGGYLAGLLFVSLALSTASLVLQVTVVQPGLTKLWNKLQKDMPVVDQFVEGAIQNGLGTAGGDSALVPDYFDMDTDGRFKGNSNDQVGRFGFFYTERLKRLEPPNIRDLDLFLKGLNELSFVEPSKYVNCNTGKNADPQVPDSDKDPCCRAIKPANCSFAISDPCRDISKAECNSCCVPLYDNGLIDNPEYQKNSRNGRAAAMTPEQCAANPTQPCTSPKIFKRLRPQGCPTDFVPAQCSGTSVYGALYPFTYDVAAQNLDTENTFQSFLEQMGRDDEHPGFVKKALTPNGTQDPGGVGFIKQDATGYHPSENYDENGKAKYKGVFALLGEMKDSTVFIAPNAGANDGRLIDKVLPLADGDFFAAPGICAQAAAGPGMSWKPGAARYCAVIENQRIIGARAGQQQTVSMAKWPYNANCPGRDLGQACMASGDVSQCADCESSADKTAYPDDPLDDMVYGLGEFTDFAKRIGSMTKPELVNTFTDWYPDMARWIAPACASGTEPDKAVECSIDGEGLLRRYAAQLGGGQTLDANGNPSGGWYKIMDDWLNREMASNQAWCVPTDTSVMGPDERYRTFGPMTTAKEGELASLTDSVQINALKANPANYLTRMGAPVVANIKEVTQCLAWNSTNRTRFNNCIAACSTAGTTDYDACYNMPRSTVAGFAVPVATVSVPTPAQKNSAMLKINCLNNCSTACTSNEVPNFDAAAMCNGALWKDTTSVGGPYQNLLNTVNTDYGGTVCRDYGKLLQSRDNASAQETLMAQRFTTLNTLRQRVEHAKVLFKDGHKYLNEFLYDSANPPRKAPAQLLIDARKTFRDNMKELPNFAIYGWQSEKLIKGQEQRGRWHIVRVEAFGPGRCGGLSGCPSRLPWVRTYTKGFMKTTRCYELTDYTGRVGVRVTRYDEGNDNALVSFANKAVALWRFVGGGSTATTAPMDVSGLNQCLGEGISDVTKGILGVNSKLEINNSTGLNNKVREEFIGLGRAFMINDKKGNSGCLMAATQLLERGVKSSSCARYSLDPNNHMGVKFVNCSQDDEGIFSAASRPGQ